ncbi:MAG TPA: trehalose-phosphatase [Vicinamibacterales bacterium]|nr:trehalose-phosphatase [Vicinamibacterales bacterium]
MIHILAKRHVHTLADFASSNVLLAFDYDGTLAPIVSDPAVAHLPRSTRRLLASAADRYPCVVISGRARHDVAKRVGSVPVFHVSGNHGLEPWAQTAAYARRVKGWVRRLRERLASYSGVVVEDKTYSVTIHYRNAVHGRRMLAAIGEAVRELRGARSLGGQDAISLVPSGAPTKGAALERARRLLACDTAIYVGDDQTDEDAFSAARADRLLAIRIGARRRSRAPYYLRNQREIDDLLRALLAFRPLNPCFAPPGLRSPGFRRLVNACRVRCCDGPSSTTRAVREEA